MQTVTRWRKLLNVKRATEGTIQLHSEVIAETGDVMREEATKMSRDPKRRRKIAEARRAKSRPQHVLDAMHEARRGSHHSEEARQRMSETHRLRGIVPPGTIVWTAEEDELIRTLPADEVVRRTGRSLIAVYPRRNRLGVPDGRKCC